MALIPPNLMVVKPSILVRCNLLSCRGVLRINVVRFFRFFFLSIFFICAGNLYPLGPLHAEETICAKVKIEIKQEMAFERQAFDAHVQITDYLTNISLNHINTDVLFLDEIGKTVRASSNPDDPDADDSRN